ncbi:MAG: hypothetical protein A2X86_12595 [Bdellovibrionales bacterium GWA2_49_15]|nr:MAG: hypothetical protein A2X86_12595 [Bdellovibrionales bacterium GWA2_49_15]HAZ14691.1 hypothetical protein [Bdellovibrionales bacterium]
MNAALAIFVKTPGLSPVKTRLAASTNSNFAEEFYLQAIGITRLVVSAATQAQPEINPYWAVAEQDGLGHFLWSDFSRLGQGDGPLGDRLAFVYNDLKRHHDAVIFIGADCPLLTAQHIIRAYDLLATRPRQDHFVIGPAQDGGFYLFAGGKHISKEEWSSVQYSQSDTKNQLSKILNKRGRVMELEPLSDIDTHDDLIGLAQTIVTKENLLDVQIKLLNWIAKSEKEKITSSAGNKKY